MSHVIIVGAGPAGASLAATLVKRNIEVTLIERQRDFNREFRGELLQPSGLNALESLGLKEQLATVPGFSMQTVSGNLSGKPVFSRQLLADRIGGKLPRAVSQPAMLEMLVAEAAKSPRFHFERGVSVKGLVHENDRVVGVTVNSDGDEREIRADLVIGSDGRNSIVRKLLELTATATSPDMDVVWCKVPCPEDYAGLDFYAGNGNLMITYRSWNDQMQIAWVIIKGTFGEIRSKGNDQWVEEMCNNVSPSFAAHLRTHKDSIKPHLLNSAANCVDSWSVPGALVIGDAAHTMSPVGGQGLNIALRDAVVAANHLTPLLTAQNLDKDALDSALKAIEKERMIEVFQVQKMQAIPPKVLINRAWWAGWVRKLLGTVLRTRFGQNMGAARAKPYLKGPVDVKLTV